MNHVIFSLKNGSRINDIVFYYNKTKLHVKFNNYFYKFNRRSYSYDSA